MRLPALPTRSQSVTYLISSSKEVKPRLSVFEALRRHKYGYGVGIWRFWIVKRSRISPCMQVEAVVAVVAVRE